MRLFFAAGDLVSFFQLENGFFAWRSATGEAKVLAQMVPGDAMVVKLAQSPSWKPEFRAIRQKYFTRQGHLNYDAWEARYKAEVVDGPRVMSGTWVVTEPPREELHDPDEHPGEPYVRVAFKKRSTFAFPLNLQQVLALHCLPLEIRRQIKLTVPRDNHVRELTPAEESLAALDAAGATRDKTPYLERFFLARASANIASLKEGDRVFKVRDDGLLLGEFVADSTGTLKQTSEVNRKVAELREMVQTHDARNGPLKLVNAERAFDDIAQLLSDGPFAQYEDFSAYYDRFVILPNKIAQLGMWLASKLSRREYTPPPGEPPIVMPPEPEGGKVVGLALEARLTPARVQERCKQLVLADHVIPDSIAAVLAGKHVVLVGPPGTGKSELAAALCKSANDDYVMSTATSDWSTFDVIGGLVPAIGGLMFREGLLLRALGTDGWLLIDELNRADVDKAFGPLLSLLSGSVEDQRPITLPWMREGAAGPEPITIGRFGTGASYEIDPDWRLVATLNLYDKASLYQLSFAFMRRFAFVHVDLPTRSRYEELLNTRAAELGVPLEAAAATCELAFATTRRLGPAIALDLLRFVNRAVALEDVGDDEPADWRRSWVSAVSAYVVPQFEGCVAGDARTLMGAVEKVAGLTDQVAELKSHLVLVTGVDL
jgi:MoxR-like ATPase